MTLLRVCLHSIVLTITDLGTIILAFGFYTMLRSRVDINQRVVQGSIAVIFCIIIFDLWSLAVTRLPTKTLSMQGSRELMWTYFAALLWVPVIFIPLHFITQGYITSFGNITAIWLFQIPVNLLALLVSKKILNLRRETLFSQ
jgi:hypothetical protein